MKLRLLALFMLLVPALPAPAENGAPAPKVRHFEFTYAASVTDIPADARSVDFWAPVPRDLAEQNVTLNQQNLPEGGTIHTDDTYGNRYFHIRWTAPFPEQMRVELIYEVKRREVFVREAKDLVSTTAPTDSPLLEKYLGPSQMVPLEGRLTAIADDLELEKSRPLRAGRRVYDYVVDLMTYGKDTPGWGRGDVLWACDSRTGNCSDFHSVFTGLTRTRDIPSYFEIGFPLPPDQTEGEIGGYHCWAWFHGGREVGWVPVDASEADKHPDLFEYYFGALTADRVAFSQGRDLTLVPPQQGPPINFFIYPYVEIDGVPGGTVRKRFTFRDLN